MDVASFLVSLVEILNAQEINQPRDGWVQNNNMKDVQGNGEVIAAHPFCVIFILIISYLPKVMNGMYNNY